MSSPGLSSSPDRGVRQPQSLTWPIRLLCSAAAGALFAAAMPPWGWWPLIVVGAALLSRVTDTPSARLRAGSGLIFGLAWLLPAIAWMWYLTPPGYLIAASAFAALHALAAVKTPIGRTRLWVGPGLHTLVEVLRWHVPFGGVPLATPAIALSASPLLAVAGIGGAVALTWIVFQTGAAIASARRQPRWAATTLVVSGAVAVAAWLAPHGSDTGTSVTVAAVQGGGKQGTSALDVPVDDVFAAHLDATATLLDENRGIDLVTWPENGIGLTTNDEPPQSFRDHRWRRAVAQQANRLAAPILVGVTEDVRFSAHPRPIDSFVNAQVVVYPDGRIGDRYEKVHLVPFGEYVPLRGVLTALGADLRLVPRDATSGIDPAHLDVVGRDGRTVTVGVMISWEVFFADRGQAALRGDGSRQADLLFNPTNGSSYTGTILQSQQIAASRLRAAETGRWVVQNAPTGFSAFVSPNGAVFDRTGVGEQAVISRAIPLRTGTTIYTRTGDVVWIAVIAAVTIFAWWRGPQPRPSQGRR